MTTLPRVLVTGASGKTGMAAVFALIEHHSDAAPAFFSSFVSSFTSFAAASSIGISVTVVERFPSRMMNLMRETNGRAAHASLLPFPKNTSLAAATEFSVRVIFTWWPSLSNMVVMASYGIIVEVVQKTREAQLWSNGLSRLGMSHAEKGQGKRKRMERRR